ncbi:hypothetical protein PTTG_28681 [Puccinia triticina 1-1 BBBD Race 1]|uniref:GCM domain-containing protein n=1 Tax=Puccinia triticina (isolate 1-1 / race 1 (BBBD)) TaxID=630390 RepID=A0A180GAF9_PUCT1|nr:hypothetical protein PTTG_28681 [Puccinia triticina 1-1 BBBD Race 1]
MKDAEPSKKKKFPKPLKTNLKLKPRPPSPPRLRKDRTAHNDDSDYEVPEVMPPNPLDDTSSDDADDESANFAESDAPKTDNDIEFNQIPTRRRNKLPGVIDSDNGFNSDNADADGSDSNPNNPDSNSGSDTSDADPKPRRQSKDKEWFLPEMNKKHKTYIDHGCSLDKEGYPIYPNGRSTFVRLPGEQVTNFGTVAYTKTSSVNFRRDRTWKVTRYFCLGALVCNNPSCNWVGNPPTGKAGKERLKKLKCKGLAGKCKGTVTHKRCPHDNVAIRFDQHLPTGWGLLWHKGTHPHPWPQAKKPDRIAKEELKAQIKKNPKAGALQLKMGKGTDPNAGFDSVVLLHPAYINKDRLAYYRQCILVKLNLIPDKLRGGSFCLLHVFVCEISAHIITFCRRGMWIISASFLPMSEHFTFQTKWMSDRLLSRDRQNQVYSGGLILDVTYQYFKTRYLPTTSMFCEELERWIPIQLTWMQGLSKEYYKIHFATLFRQFLAPSITPAKRDTLVRQVVDFSAVQVEGFVSAYLEVFRQGTRKEVRGMLKGCREHFRQSITRVKHNRALITVDQEEPFRKACMGLLDPAEPNGQTHEQKVDYIW